jgi:hypothetical protein
MSDGPDMREAGGNDLGTLELGQIWPSLNQTLVWALASVNPAMAWDEWKRTRSRIMRRPIRTSGMGCGVAMIPTTPR